ncbi:aldehyde dehydrogenase family protein (plasmid) [Rhodococcus pyridinivorans]|uniref:aldehyde dehydrogenase family protein n=1 Tax=Rhodococcus TaxID=1827 RepID=UPI0007D95240|nr:MULTISPECIES: aldehyde dehydrogenase family protein [Rhodococcus]MCT7293649.1 aldehyde dehydrogenase family protein [Rhodococcus sp. PAE-6]QXU56433.1 aldehyde dehydrogenase family protein [Rhodococcus sp. LW-XY12]UQB75802.1 aldehyde dehydrogenase [Rhodococcus ruber]UVT27490.1 aldehyde dehydrogenase family protein [Rhodococcus pyridinivorans]WML66347.1 aldehyde dehydrogenase family protein [Rhodococcus sp. AH-ZY2]
MYTTWIDGDAITSTATYGVYDPATGAEIASVPECSLADTERAIDAADRARRSFAATDLDVRRKFLDRIADHLETDRESLTELAIRDTGARIDVARTLHVDGAVARFRQWARTPAEALTPAAPADAAGVSARLYRRPVGIVGCISPYNFPLLAMSAKVSAALFSGNAVVMKPAPQDPLLVMELGRIATLAAGELGLDPGVVGTLTGSTPATGEALVADPRVGAISFTGSTHVGRAIFANAAPQVKRLLLELGGKGAVIVRADADLDQVVANVTRTWTLQSGQVCLTPSRILAHESVADRLEDRLATVLTTLRSGDLRDPNTSVGPVISATQRDHIERLVGSAAAAGRRVHQFTDLPDKGFWTAPTLVAGADAHDDVMRIEAFGPIMALSTVRSDKEAVEIANSLEFALYDYVFSADLEAAEAVASRLDAAQVGINTTARHPLAPFGGNKHSGIGRTGGTYALDAYTNLQALIARDS